MQIIQVILAPDKIAVRCAECWELLEIVDNKTTVLIRYQRYLDHRCPELVGTVPFVSR